jgi:GT2 family glycosyltransferase
MQIIVLGMHRSGTSMISGLLELMGCFFADEPLKMSPATDNPKGFWERNDIKELNDYILASAKGNWWDVDALDFSFISPQESEFIRKHIKKIIAEMNPYQPWFIKDPRICLTLQFWIEQLENPVFVHVLRHPLHIARSLQKRNQLPLEYGLCLWEFYSLALLKNLGKKTKLDLSYDAVIKNPYENSEIIYNFLSRQPGGSRLQKVSRQDVETFIDPALCHFDQTKDDTGMMAPDQYELLKKLRGSLFYDPSAEEIKKVTEKLAGIKIQSDWYDQVHDRFGAKPGDTEIRKIEKENVGLKFEKTRLEAEKARLETENARLEAENVQVRTCYSEAVDRLTALSNSRLIRGMVFVSSVLGHREKGLFAEMVKTGKLLETSETETRQSQAPEKFFSAQALPDPARLSRIKRLMRLITLSRIETTVKLLLSPKNNFSVKKRFENFKHLMNPVHTHIITERELKIIELYGLQKSSDSERPGDLTSDEAIQLFKNLKELSERFASKPSRSPVASVIVPVHNQVRFTLACIHSILDTDWGCDYEIIIADDNSSDPTQVLFGQHFPGVRYLRQESNLGFIENCNRAAKTAEGQYLIFLNNDTVVMKDWLDELINTFESAPKTGLAGSMLIYPEGRLQEAGGIVFCDGSAWNYGRFQDPSNPEFNYARDADYCSGASLAIRADVWHKVGGFDTRYRPAYYEDTDLAFKVRNAGYRVVYQPLSTVVHFEGISSGKSEKSGAKRFQRINQDKFYSKWGEVLENHGPRDPEKLPVHRFTRGKVLLIDATTPTPDKDSGSMDAFFYMKILKEIGFHVSFIPYDALYRERYTADLQRIGIECLYLPWIQNVKEAAKKMASDYDIIILCRVKTAASVINTVLSRTSTRKIIFDTVDLHFLREEREAELLKSKILARMAAKTRKLELEVIKQSHISFFRSTHEIELIKKEVPEANLVHLPIVRKMPGITNACFENRKHIVFIGGFTHPPNVDAVRYFVSDIWPRVRSRYDGKLIIAGSSMPDEIKAFAAEDIIAKGYVKDLSDLFNTCLLTVAPLRYGAGAKGKVVTSLSYGVPCVATSVAAEGCGFVDGRHLLVEDDPAAMAEKIINLATDQKRWQQISEHGLAYCRQHFSEEAVKQKLDDIIKEFYSL